MNLLTQDLRLQKNAIDKELKELDEQLAKQKITLKKWREIRANLLKVRKELAQQIREKSKPYRNHINPNVRLVKNLQKEVDIFTINRAGVQPTGWDEIPEELKKYAAKKQRKSKKK